MPLKSTICAGEKSNNLYHTTWYNKDGVTSNGQKEEINQYALDETKNGRFFFILVDVEHKIF